MLASKSLLERDAELRALDAATADVAAGRGRLVVVEGAAGTGKSSLVAAVSERATVAGLRVLSARGTELERELAFGAIRRLFEPVLATSSEAERDMLLKGAAAPAEWVIAPVDEGDRSHAHGAAGFAALHAIYWLAINVATQRPLLLVVDDLHWVDPSSLRSLDYLAERVADVPILVLLALRPAEPGAPVALLDALRTKPGALQIALGALGAHSVADLVRTKVPEADDQLCVAFHEQSSGNPLYLEELLRAVMSDDGISATEVRTASVPSLGERIARRVARVAPSAPALTSAMAVLDDGGSLAAAAKLAGIDESEAASIARQLRRIEVLAADDPLAFVHPLVRRSVYDHLSVTERDAAHETAAQVLREADAPTETIAMHLGVVRPKRSAATATALVAAAEEAMGRAAPDAAIRWLERALEEQAPEPPRAEILAELGFAEVASRDRAAIDHLRQALELPCSGPLQARVSVALAEILFHSGQWQAGRDVMTRAVAELDETDTNTVVEVLAFWAVATVYDMRLVEEFDRLQERFEQLAGGDTWAAHALCAILTVAKGMRGAPPDEVMALAEQSLRGGTLLAERGAGAWASAQVLAGLMTIDEHDRVLEICDELAEQARRCGSFIGASSSLGFRGWVLAKRGDLAGAEAELRIVSELVSQIGMPLLLTSAVFFLLDAILERPSLDEFAELVKSLELEPAFLATWNGGMLLDVRGRLRLLHGDRDGGIADLRQLYEMVTALRVGPTMSSCRSALALALASEAPDEADALVAEELEQARATGLARPEGVALRAAGILAGGKRGIELLRESLVALERSESTLEQTRTRVELGAALRRDGQRTEARELLSEGMEQAHHCGAPRLAERARQELRAAGARPRRFTRTGVESLTPSELRVGRLAARGRSNLEIAQELYVSLKTVEGHLSHAYAKLGLSGRGARDRLPDALGS